MPKGQPFGNYYNINKILPYRIVSGLSTTVIIGNWQGYRFDKTSAIAKMWGMPFEIDDEILQMDNQYVVALFMANNEPTVPPKNINWKLNYSAYKFGENITATILSEKQSPINAGDFNNKRLLITQWKLSGFFASKENYHFNWMLHRDGTDIKDTYTGDVVLLGMLFTDK